MSSKSFHLNDRAGAALARHRATSLLRGVAETQVAGASILDCGVNVPGGWQAGRLLTEVCLADLAEVRIDAADLLGQAAPRVTVLLDEPYIPCLLAQYAGWQIAEGKYFGMGSGPMRAVYAKEPIFQQLAYAEHADQVLGVLEAASLPTEDVVIRLADKLRIRPGQFTLLVARTASLAGSLQVVARSVETGLHKLHELGFDVRTIRSAIGSAWLPPIPRDDLAAIGRTNDSILYGGQITLWVECADEVIAELGPKVPASASRDYGEPFQRIFERFQGDFYQIDPLLFSPAVVTFNNLRTGRTATFGKTNPQLVYQSFFSASHP